MFIKNVYFKKLQNHHILFDDRLNLIEHVTFLLQKIVPLVDILNLNSFTYL